MRGGPWSADERAGILDYCEGDVDALARLLPVMPDPFDPENLRLDQSFVETSGVKKLLTTVPVRKPNNQDFVRVRPRATIFN